MDVSNALKALRLAAIAPDNRGVAAEEELNSAKVAKDLNRYCCDT
jgi:hypothetical protein